MLNGIKYFVYSSHKTSTQSIISTLNHNNYSSIHIHLLKDINSDKNEFLHLLKKYKNDHQKRLKIITILRNPNDRLISSFFQSNYTDMIHFKKINPEDTIIMEKNEDELIDIFQFQVKEESLLGLEESIYELSNLFEKPILPNLIKKKSYYYYDNEYIELFVLDFNLLIQSNEKTIEYLNNTLNIQIKEIIHSNLSSEKIYYSKYKNIKNILKNRKDIQDLIDKIYINKFKEFHSLFYHFDDKYSL